MKDILKELYYMETAASEEALSDRQNKEYEKERLLYNAFFDTLSAEQKELYLAYEELHGILQTEEKESLYKRAFSSGFALAQELSVAKK